MQKQEGGGGGGRGERVDSLFQNFLLYIKFQQCCFVSVVILVVVLSIDVHFLVYIVSTCWGL